ncbi:unnamed protein product, partial [Closterium sp. Yama58-4]
SVGSRVAERLGWEFYDADDFHSLENKAKMAAGTPLCDADRLPWLLSLHALLCPSHPLPLPRPSPHWGSQTHAPPQHTCQAPADSFAP